MQRGGDAFRQFRRLLGRQRVGNREQLVGCAGERAASCLSLAASDGAGRTIGLPAGVADGRAGAVRAGAVSPLQAFKTCRNTISAAFRSAAGVGACGAGAPGNAGARPFGDFRLEQHAGAHERLLHVGGGEMFHSAARAAPAPARRLRAPGPGRHRAAAARPARHPRGAAQGRSAGPPPCAPPRRAPVVEREFAARRAAPGSARHLPAQRPDRSKARRAGVPRSAGVVCALAGPGAARPMMTASPIGCRACGGVGGAPLAAGAAGLALGVDHEPGVCARTLRRNRDGAARRQRHVRAHVDGRLRQLQPEDVALDQLEDQRLHHLPRRRQRRARRSERGRERDGIGQMNGVHGQSLRRWTEPRGVGRKGEALVNASETAPSRDQGAIQGTASAGCDIPSIEMATRSNLPSAKGRWSRRDQRG